MRMMRSEGRCGWSKTAARTLGLLLLFSGCHHRQTVATLPPVLKAPDEPPPAPDSPTMQGPPPASVATAPSVTVVEAKPRRPRKKAPVKVAAATVPLPPPVAGAAPSPPVPQQPSVDLAAGGDDRARTQQEAAGLIVSIEDRLKTIPKTTSGQEAQLRNVRLFLKEAKESLATADATGAKTLATKAKLLLDDLTTQ